MAISRMLGLTRYAAPLPIILACAACVEQVRVPLAVPVQPVGGARPASPAGLHGGLYFGDGLWGQEQERAEMVGTGIGLSFGDRIEVEVSGAEPTRSVGGGDDDPASTSTLRGKMRLDDLWNGKGAVGVYAGYSWASRSRPQVQDEELTAFDLAVPVEAYFAGTPDAPHRFGVYAAPRLVVQRFRDELAAERSNGTTWGGLVGLSGRWRFLAVAGEIDVLRTAELEYQGRAYGGGWIALPTLGARVILPFRR